MRRKATKEYVATFVNDMQQKLRENEHKGGRSVWLQMKQTSLFARLNDEIDELAQAILTKTPQEIILECADVANFAMMIADNARKDIK